MYSVVLVAAMVGTPSVPACHFKIFSCTPKVITCAPKVECAPKCAPACEPKPCATSCDCGHKSCLSDKIHSLFSKFHHKKCCEPAPACSTCPTHVEPAPAAPAKPAAPETKPMPKAEGKKA